MKFLPLLAVLLAVVARVPAAEYFPPPDSQGGWRVAAGAKAIREQAGLDRPRLEDAYRICENTTPNGGLLVVRRGWLAFEKYFGRASRNANPDMASTGKAYTSIACGIMLHEFRDQLPDGLDTQVFAPKFLPEAFPLDDPRKANITLGQLLCMSAGYWGEGQTPSGTVNGGKAQPLKPVKGQDIRDLDMSSIRVPLWCAPGEGYSYSSPSPHIASMVLRRVTGTELQDYIRKKLGDPMGWESWGYCLQRGDFKMPHANGAGSIAIHATDALRMGWCLANQGKWKDQQLVPKAYIALCQKVTKYNPHFPFSLQFEHNERGQILGVPRDAFYKTGAGGFCLYIVPSLDLVIYKLGGKDGQYDPQLTGLPQPEVKHDRDGWEPKPRTAFDEGGQNGDPIWRVLQFVCAAVRD
jgi:CubicO group peptidase (beta-lactamase class C family)